MSFFGLFDGLIRYLASQQEATLEKIPYMLVVGDRDLENGTVSVRHRSGEDLGAMPLAEFAKLLAGEVADKTSSGYQRHNQKYFRYAFWESRSYGHQHLPRCP